MPSVHSVITRFHFRSGVKNAGYTPVIVDDRQKEHFVSDGVYKYNIEVHCKANNNANISALRSFMTQMKRLSLIVKSRWGTPYKTRMSSYNFKQHTPGNDVTIYAVFIARKVGKNSATLRSYSSRVSVSKGNNVEKPLTKMNKLRSRTATSRMTAVRSRAAKR